MANKFRKSPPVCLMISLLKLLTGKLRLPHQYYGCSLKMEDGQTFTVFRHITKHPNKKVEHAVTFIVRFKFARLSHNGNRVASIIPMLVIAGFPGFQTKMYALNKESGFWQGMYQWESSKHLEDYLKSFVYKMMNRRAITESISSREYKNQMLINYVDKNKIS